MALLDEVFGFLNGYADLFWAVIIILASIFIARFVQWLVINRIKAHAANTKSTLDDLLIHAIGRPIFLGILLFGIYLSLSYLQAYLPYPAEIALAFSIIYIDRPISIIIHTIITITPSFNIGCILTIRIIAVN